MKKDPMFSVTALDGRYSKKTESLSGIFSEWGLMKYRTIVEIEILLFLETTNILPRRFSQAEKNFLRELKNNFSEKDFNEIKNFEKKTNHDVKAVEYFLKARMKEGTLKDLIEYVHLGRTSEDINNIAYGLMLRDGLAKLKGEYAKIQKELGVLAKDNKNIPLLALTHGQSASPSTFGWEINVFNKRLGNVLRSLDSFSIRIKLNGATGGDNALYLAYPKVNWRKFGEEFVKNLNKNTTGTKFVNNPFTTQIEPHDTYRELFDLIRGANLILIDFSRDIWMYISRGIIAQVPKAGEVGSSAMPQKVNPIDFENAEGNLDLANSLCEFFGRKLPISRMQRDLSDSTVERNFGLVFGHTIVALASLTKGIGRIKVDKNAMLKELEDHWEVVSEGYQVLLRSLGILDGYELLKDFTRGKKVTKDIMHSFIDEAAKKYKLTKESVAKLKNITPANYIGNRSF
jgi:adenylosuccinate lyase